MTSAIRLRRLIAEEQPVLAGYDEAECARRLHYDDRPIGPSLDAAGRRPGDHRPILDRLTEDEWRRTGTHTEQRPVRRRALARDLRRATRGPRRPDRGASREAARAAAPVDTPRGTARRIGAPLMTTTRPPSGAGPAAPPAARRTRPRGRPTCDPLKSGSPKRRTVAVVLAAGLGTRMKSATPKVLHPLCGRPMIEYVLDAARRARPAPRPIVVYSPATEAVRDAVAAAADTALQDEPRGTGDALARRARGAARRRPRSPRPLGRRAARAGRAARRRCSRRAALDHAAIALVAVDALDPTGLGRVVRNDGGTVERIVEDKDATDEERQISEINAGLYAIDAAWLRRRIGDLKPLADDRRAVPHRPRRVRARGRPLVAALEIEDDGRLTGINDRAQLARAEWDMRVELNDRWMKAGVTMVDPSTVYLDHDGRARPGRHPRARRGPPRRDDGRGADADRARAPRSSTR